MTAGTQLFIEPMCTTVAAAKKLNLPAMPTVYVIVHKGVPREQMSAIHEMATRLVRDLNEITKDGLDLEPWHFSLLIVDSGNLVTSDNVTVFCAITPDNTPDERYEAVSGVMSSLSA